jgi:hypothetical protein
MKSKRSWRRVSQSNEQLTLPLYFNKVLTLQIESNEFELIASGEMTVYYQLHTEAMIDLLHEKDAIPKRPLILIEATYTARTFDQIEFVTSEGSSLTVTFNGFKYLAVDNRTYSNGYQIERGMYYNIWFSKI